MEEALRDQMYGFQYQKPLKKEATGREFSTNTVTSSGLHDEGSDEETVYSKETVQYAREEAGHTNNIVIWSRAKHEKEMYYRKKEAGERRMREQEFDAKREYQK